MRPRQVDRQLILLFAALLPQTAATLSAPRPARNAWPGPAEAEGSTGARLTSGALWAPGNERAAVPAIALSLPALGMLLELLGGKVCTAFSGADAIRITTEHQPQLLMQPLASNDPAALFKVGEILGGGRASRDPLQGYAVSIAACDLGYDCSSANMDLFGYCVAPGACPPGINYSDVIKKAVGGAGYTQAYARAQELEDALRRADAEAVQKFVQMNPPKGGR
jgi:hypothetical protein